MPYNPKVAEYRGRLEGLSYPEYALNHIDDVHGDAKGDSEFLDLSLWNDALPPGVAEVAQRALPRAVGAYQLAQDRSLIGLLAKKLGVTDDSIIVTAGADDALRITAQYCMRPSTRVLIPLPSFGRYTYHAMTQGAKIFYLRFQAYPYEFDMARIREEARKQKIECLLVASPNNPTGHALNNQSIEEFFGAASCSVILDESLLLDGHSACAAMVDRYEDLFICGSFSKLYGLPGLRIGYIVAHPAHARRLRKLVSPFGVDALALEIAKYMLIQDEWLAERISTIQNSLAGLLSLDNPYIRFTNASAPVALVEYTGSGGSLYHMLRTRGIATVAAEEFPGLDKTNAVRVIIKNMKDMQHLKRVLATVS